MRFSLLVSVAAYPLAVFLCYWMCLRGPLIFDDYEIEPRLAKFKWNWKWIRGRQRPLSSLFLAIQGKWPNTLRGLHLTNQVLHFLCAFHVEQIARYMGFDEGLAFFAGLLFCVHPLASNGVGWITGRHSLVAAFFGLGAAHAVLAGAPWLAFPLLALAFFSKEDAAGYCATVGAILIYREEFLWLVVLVLAAAFGAVWQRSLIRRLLVNTGSQIMETIGLPGALSPGTHFQTSAIATFSRIPRWAVGSGQAPYHGSGIRLRWSDFAFFVLALSLVPFIHPVAAILILTGPWLVYLLCPLPDILMEHRNYSQTAGIALALVAAVDRFPFWVMLPAIGTLAVVTALRATAYSSVMQYWTESAQHGSGDSSRAYQEMGAWSKMSGNDREAEIYLREALRINPVLAPALNNLGWLLIAKGNKEKDAAVLAEGALCLSRCVEVAPKWALGWQDHGILIENSGKLEEAYSCYRQALDLEPQLTGAMNRLGMASFMKRDFAQARKLFDAAHRLQPNNLEFFYNKAVTLKHDGDPAEAQLMFNQLPKPCPLTANMLPVEYAK